MTDRNLRLQGYSRSEILEINNCKEDYAGNGVKYSQKTPQELSGRGFSWTNGHTLTSYSNLKVTSTCDSSVSPTYTVPDSYKDAIVPDAALRFKFPTANDAGWLYK